jgi:hypothetical protein
LTKFNEAKNDTVPNSGKGVSVKTEIDEIVISKVGLSKKCDGDILLTGNRTALLMLFY